MKQVEGLKRREREREEAIIKDAQLRVRAKEEERARIRKEAKDSC